MIGQTFGRLTVAVEAERRGYDRRYLCQCSCGVEKTVYAANLRNGSTNSCGCAKREMLLIRNSQLATHRMSKTTEYLTWTNIHRRCEDPKDKSYARYGAIGVSVCKRWRKFENFLADMGLKPTPKHQIERRSNSERYKPGNCYWASTHRQSRNKSSNVTVIYEGVQMVLRDACYLAQLNYWTVWSRIDRDLPPEAWFKPVKGKA